MLERARAGDCAAQAELAAWVWRRALECARARGSADPEEIAAEASDRVLRAVLVTRAFEGDDRSLSRYLARAVERLSYARPRVVLTEPAALEDALADRGTPRAAYPGSSDAGELWQRTFRAFRATRRSWALLVCKGVLGLSSSETATALGIRGRDPANLVDRAWSRARAAAQQVLECDEELATLLAERAARSRSG